MKSRARMVSLLGALRPLAPPAGPMPRGAVGAVYLEGAAGVRAAFVLGGLDHHEAPVVRSLGREEVHRPRREEDGDGPRWKASGVKWLCRGREAITGGGDQLLDVSAGCHRSGPTVMLRASG